MTAPRGYHLAELNIGRLIAPVDDPRIADFMRALDKVNTIAKRSPGFVWMMEGAAGNTDTKIDGDDRFISNLSVWESVQSLEAYVWQTVHRQFYARRAEWFEVLGKLHFVMWWVPIGHQPLLQEGLERLAFLRANGDTERAFGWSYLTDAQIWKTHQCSTIAAE